MRFSNFLIVLTRDPEPEQKNLPIIIQNYQSKTEMRFSPPPQAMPQIAPKKISLYNVPQNLDRHLK